ncbi:peptidase C39 family protein [Pseudofrancisella aestuarii]|uniref:Peptidase C39 family protein n=1 Tax=Pseudofrancisella aestuarii TaxID=2670347 RepID=A0ABV9TD36_9GAMM|nr:peptidase C39 family protein [Pseudofrancisella aestuarii]
MIKTLLKFLTITLIFMNYAYSYQNFADKKMIEQVVKTFDLPSDKNITMLNIQDYQQTTDYTCGPAAIMTLMHYYGLLKDSDMNKETEIKIAEELKIDNDYGTTPENMANWLKTHGLEVEQGTNGNIQMLVDNLNKGIPTLVDWIDWGGHWVLVTGYQKLGNSVDDDKDLIFFTDPAVHFNNVKTIYGLTAINPDRFQAMWFDSKQVPGIYITVYKKD